MKRLLLFFSLLFASVCMIAQSVTFSNVRLNTNAVKDGVPGVKITTDVRFTNLKGKIVGIVVSFYDESKNYWCTRTPINEDLTFQIGDNNYLVCAMKAFELDNDNIFTKDHEFFISKKDLHLKKDYNSYYYDITAVTTDSGKRLGRTSYSFFQMSGTGNNVGFAVAQNTSSTQYDTKKLSTQESRSSVTKATNLVTINKTTIDFSRRKDGVQTMDFNFDLNIPKISGKGLAILTLMNGNDIMYSRELKDGKRVPVQSRTTFDTPYENNHWKDFKISIPVNDINVPDKATDYNYSITFYKTNGSEKTQIGYLAPTKISKITNYYFLSSNRKNNTIYTNNNPMYERIRHWGLITEFYGVGETCFDNTSWKGWYHQREIKEAGVEEEFGFRKDGLFNGLNIKYYWKAPEGVCVQYQENGSTKYFRYMKQKEAVKYKDIAMNELRKKGLEPLSDRHQSKVNTSYLSRDNEYTFKGALNPKDAINNMGTSQYAGLYGPNSRKTSSSSSSSSSSYSSSSSSYSSSSSSSSNSKLSTGTIIAGMAALAYAIIKGAEALDNTIENTRKANEEKRAAQRSKIEKESVYEYSNVEIVNWATFNWLSAAEAEVSIRNKNNYDVDVIIELYRGKWDEGRITYTDLHRGDRIPGVSDEHSTTIRVKANSMRKVYLSSGGSGRPTAIRISYVN